MRRERTGKDNRTGRSSRRHSDASAVCCAESCTLQRRYFDLTLLRWRYCIPPPSFVSCIVQVLLLSATSCSSPAGLAPRCPCRQQWIPLPWLQQWRLVDVNLLLGPCEQSPGSVQHPGGIWRVWRQVKVVLQYVIEIQRQWNQSIYKGKVLGTKYCKLAAATFHRWSIIPIPLRGGMPLLLLSFALKALAIPLEMFSQCCTKQYKCRIYVNRQAREACWPAAYVLPFWHPVKSFNGSLLWRGYQMLAQC
jgi:hypothetical protein